ncbi:uncharacterized protein LOC116350537 [Contarinia nasturtii]|uniref:uncharacterized protein LOC116350537 n=1 Tax=Contarinia nasturtii TaxID=265458 RepID=UPI0012D415C4|nr:uncharacterized protein LOC116350537 [Contarinia nasturtii]
MYINPPQVTKDTAHVLFAQFCILNKVLWPIIPHLVEEVWSYYSKTESFYKHQFTVPSEWHNSEFDVTMDIVKELFGMIMHNSVKNSVYYDTKIFGTAEQIQQLQKLHPSDDQAHNDSHLCEILQVQSIQLVESPSSKLYIEKTEIDKKLCDRCRRFAVASDETICKRCDNILKEMNFTP